MRRMIHRLLTLEKKHCVTTLLSMGLVMSFIYLTHFTNVFAAARTWDGGGVDNNWSTAANWDGDTPLAAGDTVTFDATSTKASTIDAGFAGTIGGITISAGYTGGTAILTQSRSLTITNSFAMADGVFTGSSNTSHTMTVGGTFSLTGGTFTAPAGTLELQANFSPTGGTFTHNSGTVKWNNSCLCTRTMDMAAAQVTLYNLTVTLNGGWGYTLASGDTLEVVGTLDLIDGNINSGGGGAKIKLNTDNATAQASFGAGFDGGSVILEITGSGTRTWTIAAGGDIPALNLNAANVTIDTVTSATAGSVGSTCGASTLTNGTIDFRNMPMAICGLTQAGGTFYSGNSSNTTSFSTNNLAVNGGTFNHGSAALTLTGLDLSVGGGTFVGGSGAITVSNFSLTSGAFTSTSGNFSTYAAFTATGGTFTHNSGTVILESQCSCTKTINVADATPLSLNHLTIGGPNSSGWGFSLSGADQLTVAGTLTFGTQSMSSGGGINATGNIHQNNSSSSGSTVVTINGTGAQTFTGAATSGGSVNPIVINKSSNTLTLGNGTDDTIRTSNNWTYTAGTVDATTQGTTVIFTGGTLDGQGTSATMAFDDVQFPSGSTTLGGNLNIDGDLTLNGGTLVATGYTINLAGTWTKSSGTFTHGSNSTVVMDGTNQSLTGATTFYNFTKSVTSADTITFPANTTMTFAGTLTLQGAASQLLSIRSSSNAQATLAPQSTKTVNYVDVQYSAVSATTIDVSAGTAVNSGNNSGWTFLYTLQFSAASGSAAEGSGGGNSTVSLTVSVDNSPGENVSADYKVTSGSVGTDDYTLADGTVTISNGVSNTFDLSVTKDAIFEGSETVIITLSNPTATTLATALGTNTTYTHTISNDDSPTVNLTAAQSFSQTNWDGGTGTSTTNQYSASSNVTTSTTGQMSLAGASPWYNSSWGYRKSFTVTEQTGSTLTNFQVKLTVTYDSDMQADFDDIRFADSDETTLLDFWLEDKTNSSTADFWIEVPTLTASQARTLYMYYGNSGASSASNIQNTFLYGDDFSDNTWTTSNWTDTETKAGGNRYTVSNAQLYYPSTQNGDNQFPTYTINNSSVTNGIIEVLMKPISCGNSYGKGVTARYQNDSNQYIAGLEAWGAGNTHIGKRVSGTWTNIDQDAMSCSTTAWYFVKFTLNGTTQALAVTNNSTDSTVNSSGTDTSLQSAGKVGIAIDNTEQAVGSYWDDFRVRQYAATEPAIGSLSAEGAYLPSSGTLTSATFDVGNTTSAWGILSYTTDIGMGTAVKVRTDSNADMSGATAWGSCSAIARGADITGGCVTDGHRYMEYQVTLTKTNTISPVFQDITIQSLNAASAAANEGTSGTTTITVTATLSATTASTVTVPFTVSGSANNPSDHTLSDGNITVSANQATGTTTFTVNGDTTVETSETVILTMGTPTNAVAGVSPYTYTITNDDFNVAPTLTINSAATKTDGSGTVDISTTVADSDANNVKLKLLYALRTGGSCGDETFSTKPTLDETAANVSASVGTKPTVENDDSYQVGTTTGITTSSSNTVQFDWASRTDLGAVDGNYCLQITPNDGTTDGTAVIQDVTIDNLTTLAGPVTSLAATNTTSSSSYQLQLTWTNASQTGMKIERDNACDGSYDVSVYDSATTNATSPYTDSGSLAANTCYKYRFGSYNAGGVLNDISYAISSNFTTPPAQVTGVTADNIEINEISWSWAAVTGADRYKVYNNSGNVLLTTTTSRSYTWTGLSANTAYAIYVRAVHDTNGEGISSSVATVTTDSDAPTGLDHTNQTTAAIRWTWTNGGQSSFYARDAANTSTNSGFITDAFWDQTGLSTNTAYTLQVKARNASNIDTAYSQITRYTSQNSPTGVAFSNVTTSGITATAQGTFANLGTGSAAVHFNNGAGSTQQVTDSSNLVWANTNLNPNTQYTYTVHATNGDADTTTTVSASQATLANAPGVPTVSNPTSTTLRVTIDANGNPAATEFSIQETGSLNYVQSNGTLGVGAVWQTAAQWGGSGTSGVVTVTGLTANGSYIFTVKARNLDRIETSAVSAPSAVRAAAIAPGTPTLTAETDSTVDLTIAANGNPAEVTYAIRETGSNRYVQSDGTLGGTAVWRTLSEWGTLTQVSGKIQIMRLEAVTRYTFEVVARNGDLVTTSASVTASVTTLSSGSQRHSSNEEEETTTPTTTPTPTTNPTTTPTTTTTTPTPTTTTPTTTVNPSGSANQDRDNDGVANAADICDADTTGQQDTPSGVTVDPLNGCPVVVIDATSLSEPFIPYLMAQISGIGAQVQFFPSNRIFASGLPAGTWYLDNTNGISFQVSTDGRISFDSSLANVFSGNVPGRLIITGIAIRVQSAEITPRDNFRLYNEDQMSEAMGILQTLKLYPGFYSPFSNRSAAWRLSPQGAISWNSIYNPIYAFSGNTLTVQGVPVCIRQDSLSVSYRLVGVPGSSVYLNGSHDFSILPYNQVDPGFSATNYYVQARDLASSERKNFRLDMNPLALIDPEDNETGNQIRLSFNNQGTLQTLLVSLGSCNSTTTTTPSGTTTSPTSAPTSTPTTSGGGAPVVTTPGADSDEEESILEQLRDTINNNNTPNLCRSKLSYQSLQDIRNYVTNQRQTHGRAGGRQQARTQLDFNKDGQFDMQDLIWFLLCLRGRIST